MGTVADNTTLNSGTGGDVIATDDIGGTKHQLVKVEFGAADSATQVSAANPLPVDNSNTTVADGGTLPAKGIQVGGTDGAVFQVLSTDNAGRLNTNVNGTVAVSAASLPLPAGASTSAKQPVLGTAGSASADVISVQGVASMTAVKTDGSAVTQPVSGTVTANAGTGTLSTNQAQIAGTATSVNSGVKDAGTQRVVIATDQVQLTNALKVDGSAVTQPVSGTVTASGPLTDTQLRATAVPVSGTVTANPAAATTGGATPNTYVSAATTNATSVKASAGTLYGIIVSNVNAAARYLKVFNKASAPTVGTDTPVMNIIIPGNTAGAGNTIPLDGVGVAFGTGIAFAITTGVALLDSGAVAASEITVTLLTK